MGQQTSNKKDSRIRCHGECNQRRGVTAYGPLELKSEAPECHDCKQFSKPKQVIVDATCMKCAEVHAGTFAWMLCAFCKTTDAYLYSNYQTDYTVHTER